MKLVRTWAVTIAFTLGAVFVCLILVNIGDAGLNFDLSQSFGDLKSQIALTVFLAALSGALVDALRLIGYIVWHTKPSFRIKLHKIMRQNLA